MVLVRAVVEFVFLLCRDAMALVVQAVDDTTVFAGVLNGSIECHRSYLETPLVAGTRHFADRFEPGVLKTIVWYLSFHLHHPAFKILPATLMVHVVVAEPAAVVPTHQTWPASDNFKWMISKVDVS